MARKKISLREFQQGVLDKLKAVSEKEGARPSSKLGLQVGQLFWLVDLADVAEVVPPPAMAHVPLSQPWFAGVANVRGNLYSVADFSLFCGKEPVATGPDRRLVLAHAKFKVNAALLVTRLLGLKHNEDLTATAISNTAPPWVSAEYTDKDGTHWQELSMLELVNNQDFLQAGQ